MPVMFPPIGKVPVPQCQTQFLPAVQVEFHKDFLQMGLHGFGCDVQHPGDLVIPVPEAGQRHHLLLPFREGIPALLQITPEHELVPADLRKVGNHFLFGTVLLPCHLFYDCHHFLILEKDARSLGRFMAFEQTPQECRQKGHEGHYIRTYVPSQAGLFRRLMV